MAAILDPSAYISTVTGRAFDQWGKSNDQYQWAKDQFAKNQGTSDKVVNQALDTGADFGNYAKTDRAQYEKNVMPAMDEQMNFARNYTTPGRMAANRSSAIGGVNLAATQARKGSEDQLMSFGVDPASGRFAGLDAALRSKQGALQAGAGTKSDRDTEMLGQQYLANAIKTGQVLPGQVANEAATGMAAGNQAVNAGLATTASGSATMGTPIQWAGLGNDMIKQWEAAQRDAANVALAQQKLDQGASSGTGAAIGAGAGILGGLLKGAGGLGSIFGSDSGTIMNAGSQGSGAGGIYTTADTTGAGGIFDSIGGATPMFAAKGGTIRRYAGGGSVDGESGLWDGVDGVAGSFAKGGAAHDLLGMAGSAAGMLIPIPVLGPMIGKFAGNALGDVIEGNTGEIGDDAERDFTFGMADPDSPGGFNPSGLFGAGAAGGSAAMSFMAEGGDVPTSEVSGGGSQEGNMVPPHASPSGGANTDDVHAMVSVDEFVVPKDVAKWVGEKYLQQLIEKSRKEMMGATAQAEPANVTPQAMAMSAPSFRSEGARA